MTPHEALWPKDLFERGIGWVIVARFKSAGQRVEAGVFLVDVWCGRGRAVLLSSLRDTTQLALSVQA